MKKAVLVLASLLSFSAFAGEITVSDSGSLYETKRISAKGVGGIDIKLSHRIKRTDCNNVSFHAEPKLVSGDGKGWYDSYLIDVTMAATEMHCPLEKPVMETLLSEPIRIKSFSNANVSGEVQITVIVPKGMKLQVTEAK